MVLTDFLLARIAEDSAEARAALRTLSWGRPVDVKRRSTRVLAESEAKCTLIERASYYELEWEMLVPFAAVYSDHPDYREEWRL